jgi:hypothetical protein
VASIVDVAQKHILNPLFQIPSLRLGELLLKVFLFIF